MHSLLQEVVDGYEGDEFEPLSGDLHVTQHNLVLVILRSSVILLKLAMVGVRSPTACSKRLFCRVQLKNSVKSSAE